jgi:predicted aspartyl protease
MKRKAISQGQGSSSIHTRYVPPKCTPVRTRGGQRLAQYTPQGTPPTCQAAPTGTLTKFSVSGQSVGTTCYKCGKTGHYAIVCPQRIATTPMQNKQQTLGSSNGFTIVRVNQVSADATTEGADIALGMFYINAIHAAILFDSGATHSFMSSRYANTNELPLQYMKTPMVVITPKGPVEANYMTHRLTLTIMGREFWATPIVLEESRIDLILGMSWLRKAKVVIHYARGTVELTSSKGERSEVEIIVTASTRPVVFLVDGKFVGDNIRVV